jgi:glycosyltransferase involved in cell wall biosynthesis
VRTRSWARRNRSWDLRKGRRTEATRGAVGDAPDAEAIKNAAAASFAAEYGPGPGAPIAVVVPAFNEIGSIASVVGAIPTRIGDLDTEVVVIDDGSTDSTAGEARAAGAMVCRLSVNLGQGHALRLGYRLASQRRASLIATVDADGQFDPKELPALIAPLVTGAADFVNGSRRLGRSETSDPVRKLGVVVFSFLFRVLTGVGVTDPACGLRAFRVEIPEQVRLRQAQYQTSELLIGVVAHGFRVVEVPVTVYARTSGASKKGGNLAYGFRFGRVVLSSWWASMPAARRRRT